MARSTHNSKLNIVATLKRLGASGPTAIAKEMGEEWLGAKKFNALRQLLRSMAQAHVLVRPRVGLYDVSPSCDLRSLDVRDATTASVRRFLIDCGGVARTREIHEALTGRRLSGGQRNYDHRRVTLVLKNCFKQDFGRGYWNLPSEVLDSLPLLGRWADYRHQVASFEKGKSTGATSWQAKRDDFFAGVGGAFMDARGHRNTLDVVAHDVVAAALRKMGLGAPSARREALDLISAEATQFLADKGIFDPWRVAEEVRRRKDDELAWYLFSAFELGDPELHIAAPVEFYNACAGLFGVCAARLSRGEVTPQNVVQKASRMEPNNAAFLRSDT